MVALRFFKCISVLDTFFDRNWCEWGFLTALCFLELLLLSILVRAERSCFCVFGVIFIGSVHPVYHDSMVILVAMVNAWKHLDVNVESSGSVKSELSRPDTPVLC